MSEYLWDKTGEPDAEVVRLEALLDGLGHKPRTLALPALAAEATPDVRRRPRLLAWAGLAAAAALLVVSLAGAFALLRARTAAEGKSAAASEPLRPPPGWRQGLSNKAPEPARTGGAEHEIAAGVEPVRGPSQRRGEQTASLPRRRQGLASAARDGATTPGGAPAFEALSTNGGAPSLFESTRLMAKEQLVYALRLTGAKLKEVERKTHGAGDSKAPARVGVR